MSDWMIGFFSNILHSGMAGIVLVLVLDIGVVVGSTKRGNRNSSEGGGGRKAVVELEMPFSC